MSWIDISVPIQNGMVHWPGDPAYESHLKKSIGDANNSPCNLTHMKMSAHTGTHMDAPRHFIDGGATMEALPIDAVMGPCRVIEISDPVAITASELEPHGLKRGDRILFKTRNSEHSWKTNDFDEDFVYVTQEAARHITQHGVMTVGVDYLSVGGYKKDGIETHVELLRAEVWIIEGLNLSGIKAGEYDLACLPLKLVGSDGAPARAALRPR
ncbi:MAG: cyclase family protein [Verrucomicrobiota bacterium]|nr:cyclase family protein [Verrucomicrobiota bacterium]